MVMGKNENCQLDVVYLDNHLLAVRKPAGILVQGDRTGDKTLYDISRTYLKEKFNKPGNVFLGIVHRLDRPVSGIVIFARTSKSAARLSEQIRRKRVKKIYWALVQGKIIKEDKLTDNIARSRTKSYIEQSNLGKRAELNFKRLAYHDGISFVEVELLTGRHHQIRVQFSSRHHPVLGDVRYGATQNFYQKQLALHARSFSLVHPVKNKYMTFTAKVDTAWNRYANLIKYGKQSRG